MGKPKLPSREMRELEQLVEILDHGFDHCQDIDLKMPGRVAYVSGSHDTLAHIVACVLVSRFGFTEGVATSDALELIVDDPSMEPIRDKAKLLENLVTFVVEARDG